MDLTNSLLAVFQRALAMVGDKTVYPLRSMMSRMAICQLIYDMFCKQVDILAQCWLKKTHGVSKALEADPLGSMNMLIIYHGSLPII